MKNPRTWTFAYIAWNLLGLAVAIDRGLPGAFLGFSTGMSPLRDFLYGLGAALAAPLIWLIVLALVAVRSARPDELGRKLTLVLAVLLTGNVIGMLGEPIVYEQVDDFDSLIASTIAGMIFIPAVGAALAMIEYRRRSRRPIVGRSFEGP